MASLPKYTLSFDSKVGKWVLKNDGSGRIAGSWTTKEAAVSGGTLERAVGADGGSVRIHKLDGKFEEERTYPRKSDPRRSPG